jgi:hypothetical protein
MFASTSAVAKIVYFDVVIVNRSTNFMWSTTQGTCLSKNVHYFNNRITPHKIKNFAHNTSSPSTTHMRSAVALNNLKFCVTLRKPSRNPQIHVKPTTKQCTNISRTERGMTWNLATVAPPTVAEIANNLPILTNVKCCSCLSYKLSPFSYNNNKMQNIA